MTKTTATVEEYLETIYMMAAESQIVKGARLAQIMHVSRPTVTATLRRMARDRLVTLNAKKEVALTKNGLATAEELQRRHRIVERWLTDVLKLDWAESDGEAHRLEHAVSGKVVDRLNEMMGFPATCPHGNPIPGNAQGAHLHVLPLSQAREGDRVRVTRISEYVENAAEMLKHLGERGLKPGAELDVVDISSLHDSFTLRLAEKHFALDHQIADYVWVTKI